MLGEALEAQGGKCRPCRVCTGPILDGCDCEGQTAHTGELGGILISRERAAQIERHGFTPGHDDAQEVSNELSEGARAYLWHAITTAKTGRVCKNPPPGWPWLADEFAAANELEALVKAGALIAARIDQLARQWPELLDY